MTGVGALAAAAAALADSAEDTAVCAEFLAGDCACGAGRSPAGAALAFPAEGAEEFFCPSDDENAVGPAGALAAERAATAANDMGNGAAALGEGPSDMIAWVLAVIFDIRQVNSIEIPPGVSPLSQIDSNEKIPRNALRHNLCHLRFSERYRPNNLTDGQPNKVFV